MSYFSHPTAIIDPGCHIGNNTKIWHFSHIMAGARIGACCNIGQNVVVSPDVVLGNNVKVQNNVSIYTGVICEDDVFLGPSCVFTNIINPRSAVNRKAQFATTHIGRGATIGANATIICGRSEEVDGRSEEVDGRSEEIGRRSEEVGGRSEEIGGRSEEIFGRRIGAYAFVGAGAVVTKNVPDYALVVGNPARQTGWVSKMGHKLSFNETGRAQCPESGEWYHLRHLFVEEDESSTA